MIRAARIVAVGLVLVLLLVAVNLLVHSLTGLGVVIVGPPVIDCGGLEPVTCELAFAEMSAYSERMSSGPVTYFRFGPGMGSPECGITTLERGVFTVGPFALVNQWVSQPLC